MDVDVRVVVVTFINGDRLSFELDVGHGDAVSIAEARVRMDSSPVHGSLLLPGRKTLPVLTRIDPESVVGVYVVR
jgi:hypothetical protein